MTCWMCGHSLVKNDHGYDQNDGWMEGDKLVHSGHCTYCRVCNPGIFNVSTESKLAELQRNTRNKITPKPPQVDDEGDPIPF